MTAAALGTKTVVCAGFRQLTGGVLGVAFIECANGLVPDVEREKYFAAKKGIKSMVVGGMYEIEANDDLSRVSLASAKYIRPYPDESKVAAWRLMSRAEEVAVRAKKDEAKFKRTNVLADLLVDVRRQYLKADHIGRIAIEVAVLRALRYGSD